jgi:hypothetical protein
MRIQQEQLKVSRLLAVGEKGDCPAVRRVLRQSIFVGPEREHLCTARRYVNSANACSGSAFQAIHYCARKNRVLSIGSYVDIRGIADLTGSRLSELQIEFFSFPV